MASSSSSGRRYRLLEVGVKSANLNTKRKGLFYVKLWIDQEARLQTERVYCTGGANPVWDKRFVFAVPHTFVADKSSSVCFEIFRARKGFRDSSIGKADGNNLELEKDSNEDSVEDDDEAKYDTANEYSDEESEEEKEQVDLSELKGSASLRVAKGSETKGELKVEMVVWKGYLKRVGNCKWRRRAMDYDEFMALKEGTEKAKKNHFWRCFYDGYAKD